MPFSPPSFLSKGPKRNTHKTKENKELSQFPNSYDNPHIPDRRLERTSRLLTMIVVGQSLLCTTLICTLFSLIPLHSIQPLPIERGDGDNILAQIQPITDTMGGANLLAQDYCLQYVIYRHEIVRSDLIMSQRWMPGGFIDAMSANDEFQRFTQANSNILHDIRSSNDTAEVHLDGNINTLKKLEGEQNGTYQIGFEIIIRSATGAEISRRHFIASMEVALIPYEKMPEQQRENNPAGLKVQNYTLAQRNSVTETLAQ